MLTRRAFFQGILASIALAATPLPTPAEAGEYVGVNLDQYANLPKHKVLIGTGKKTPTNIYKARSTKSKKIAYTQQKGSLVIDTSRLKSGIHHKWLKVKLANKKHGYVRVKDVRLTVVNTKHFWMDPSTRKFSKRVKVCRFGFKYLGTPWVHSGRSLTKGISCNEFAAQSYRHAGVSVKGSSLQAIGTSGKKIKRSQLKPGDLVCYGRSNKSISHVAIYIGKGFVINCSGAYGRTYPQGGIRISKMSYRSMESATFRNVIG